MPVEVDRMWPFEDGPQDPFRLLEASVRLGRQVEGTGWVLTLAVNDAATTFPR
jgi:hypothetical protein